MKYAGFVILALLTMLCLCACTEISQEIYMNHDGSGKIVERVTLTPRGQRLMRRLQQRTGQATVEPIFVSDAFLQKRFANQIEAHEHHFPRNRSTYLSVAG